MRKTLFALLLAACGTLPGGKLLFDERFEDEATFRSTWQVTGDVWFVTTYHPAEHALVARGAATLVAPFSDEIYDTSGDGEWLEYSTPCPGEPELWAEQSGTAWTVHASIPAGAPVAWRRVHANFPSITIDPGGTTISGLVLELDDPAAACPIDNLRIYQPTFVPL